MNEPTFEQQRETAREVIEGLKNISYNALGICYFLPDSNNPIKLYLPKYYNEVGSERKEFSELPRRLHIYWFSCNMAGKQQRIESLKRVYNL